MFRSTIDGYLKKNKNTPLEKDAKDNQVSKSNSQPPSDSTKTIASKTISENNENAEDKRGL